MTEHTVAEARAARAAKALALASLEESKRTLEEVLRRVPPALRGCDLWYVLLACPNLGRTGARRMCEDAHVWPHIRMGELTRAQRTALMHARPNRVH